MGSTSFSPSSSLTPDTAAFDPVPVSSGAGPGSPVATVRVASATRGCMEAISQSVWYMVTPPCLSGTLTLMVLRCFSAPVRASTTERSLKN